MKSDQGYKKIHILIKMIQTPAVKSFSQRELSGSQSPWHTSYLPLTRMKNYLLFFSCQYFLSFEFLAVW